MNCRASIKRRTRRPRLSLNNVPLMSEVIAKAKAGREAEGGIAFPPKQKGAQCHEA